MQKFQSMPNDQILQRQKKLGELRHEAEPRGSEDWRVAHGLVANGIQIKHCSPNLGWSDCKIQIAKKVRLQTCNFPSCIFFALGCPNHKKKIQIYMKSCL